MSRARWADGMFVAAWALAIAACGGRATGGQDAATEGSSAGNQAAAAAGGGAERSGTASDVTVQVDGGASAEVDALPACQLDSDDQTWIAFDSDRDESDREIYLVRPDGSDLRRMTTSVGLDQEPAFSPDGKWLSFTSDRDGSLQIFLLDVLTSDVKQLTHRPDGAAQSSFSHDGKSLAFHSGTGLYTISVNGAVEQLVAAAGANDDYLSPQFTINDSELLFETNSALGVTSLDGSTLRWVLKSGSVHAPSPSPNGRDVAYSAICDSGSRKQSIWLSPYSMTTDACLQGVRFTAPGALSSEHPTWSPDGKRLAYARRDISRSVSQIAVTSRAREQHACAATSSEADGRNPAWGVAAR